MTHGSLFSGRGTWDIVAQELGFENKFNCEINTWLRHKLKRISPDAKQYTNAETCFPDCTVTVLSASFPCQNISFAGGKNATGIFGIKSGIWREVKRVFAITQPRYIVIENSHSLTKMGLEICLSDLSEIGYDAEWHCLQGRDFGFPQRRERIFIIAYPDCFRRVEGRLVFQPPGAIELSRAWSPTPAYLRLLACRADGWRGPRTIQRGDVVHNFRRELHAFGNAVMPVLIEHLLKCIVEDYKYMKYEIN